MRNFWLRSFTALLVCTLGGSLTVRAQNSSAQGKMNWDEFKGALMKRYDQKVVVTRVAGLQAGEKKTEFGAGQAAMHWHHFHPSVPIPQKLVSGLHINKLSDMQQLDERTYGMLLGGINVTTIDRNERLKVSKFYVYDSYVDFVLATTEVSHLRDIETTKASRERYGNALVTDLGLEFRFHFDKQSVMKAGDYQTVVAEIGKYLLPKEEAEAAINAEKNIEIEIGAPEESVIQKLGQPVRSIKVGDQKFLKYKEMTVVLKDGKVAEVKVD